MKKSDFTPESWQQCINDVKEEYGKEIADAYQKLYDELPPDGDIQLTSAFKEVYDKHYKQHGCSILEHGHMRYNS